MIWCVDHDAQRRNLEIHALRCVGMDAKGYDSADSFWKDLQKDCPELILLDAALPGVDPNILDPRDTYADPAQWDEKAKDLAARFQKNFAKFTGNEAGKALVAAGPQL